MANVSLQVWPSAFHAVSAMLAGMDTTSFLLGNWQRFVALIGTEDELDESARQHGAIVRRRVIRSGEDLLRLIMAWSVCGCRRQSESA
jgi:hypothetical protein